MSSKWDIFNKKEVPLDSPTTYLSFVDMALVDGFLDCLKNKDKDAFEAIMYKHGANIHKPYYVVHCKHRSRISNAIYDNYVLRAEERLDNEWLKHGAATLDAWVASTDDASMRSDMERMRKDNLTEVVMQAEINRIKKGAK